MPTSAGSDCPEGSTAHDAADGGSADDATLIQHSWEEPEAFAVIFDRHAERIQRYVTYRLGQRIAPDVVGDTFLEAFRRRMSYDLTRSSALPWLYGIASNLIGLHRRAEVRAYRAFARLGASQASEPFTEQVHGRVVAQSAERSLAAGLARLSRRDRDVILLVAWEDLSYDEAADALGIPVGTVRSRLNRARRKLREALGDVDPRAVAEEGEHG